MKIIVSDYDDTFYLHKINKIKNYIKIKQNIKAVKNFRRKGNLFIIATGRYYDSIIKEINKYKIEFDYLICNNGADIYDKKCNLIYLKKLPSLAIDNLNKLNFKLIKDGSKKEVVAAINYNVNKKIVDEIKRIQDVIVEVKSYKIKVIPKTNKLDAIKKIIKNYKEVEVYTFGDGENDLEMLNVYTGATLNKEISNKKIKLISNLASEINILTKK